MKKIGADECDTAFALTFFLTIFTSSVLFLTIFLLLNFVEKAYPDGQKFDLGLLRH